MKQWILSDIYDAVPLEEYIERFLLTKEQVAATYESIYDMGNAEELTSGYKTDGKPIRKTVYGSTRQEVDQEVAMLSVEVAKVGYTTVLARDETNFQTLCKEWFDLFSAPGLASCAEENRRRMMKLHIFSELGTMDIKDIDTKRLQRLFNAKAELSADYIGKMKNLLNNFL